MTNYYLIQVENVLTEDQAIPAQFGRWFEEWMKTHDVVLFSSLSFSEINTQLRSSIVMKSRLVFSKSGRTIVDGKTSKVLFEEKGTSVSNKLIDWATKHAGNTAKTELRGSQFIRNHAGLLSVSPVGYDIDSDAVKKYQTWDKKSKERTRLILELQATFPDVHAKLDSTVGIEVQSSTPSRPITYWFQDIESTDSLTIYCTSETAQSLRDLLQDVQYKWQINISNSPNTTFQTMKHYASR